MECHPTNGSLFNGTSLLHRIIWEDNFGKIPKSHEIHHKDRIRSNNDINNLQLISGRNHARLHIKERLKKGGDLHKKLKKWRSSEEDKQVLRSNIEKCRKNTKEREFTCSNCGKVVNTNHPTKRFCSKECTESTSGKIEKSCVICNTLFWTKPNNKKETQTCGYSCGWNLRRRNSI
jgi:hypothetical protein